MVADIDLKTIHEMQDVRACLEGMIARLAAQRIGLEDLSILEKFVIKMEQATLELDIEEYTRNNNAFHTHIASCCGNDYLVDSLHAILKKTIHRPCRTWEGLGDVEHTNRCHREILEALKTHEALRAQEAATQHVLNALERKSISCNSMTAWPIPRGMSHTRRRLIPLGISPLRQWSGKPGC